MSEGAAEQAERRKALVAQGYAMGWSFVALTGKVPTAKGWSRRPRESRNETLAWAEAGNVGLRTGRASGVVVVDIDPGAVVADLPGELPATVEVTTGRGGRHLYYRHTGPCPNSAGKLAPHVDVRGDGGQVVFPGSVHPESGRVYEWKYAPGEYDLADLPAWVIEALTRPRATAPTERTRPGVDREAQRQTRYAARALTFEAHAVASAPEGTRNDTLNTAAFNLGTLLGGGALDRAHVETALMTAAQSAGLDDAEAAATIRSGIEAGLQHPRAVPAPRKRTPHNGPITAPADADTTVLIPGPHVTADGEYIEQTSPAFAEQVLDLFPEDVLYRKELIPGQLLGEPGKRRFSELGHDEGRLLIDAHMRLAAWYAKKTPEGPSSAQVYKPACRDHAGLMIASARTHPNVRPLDLLVGYPAYGPGFERLAPGWQEGRGRGVYYDEPADLRHMTPETNPEAIGQLLEDLMVDFPFRDQASKENFFGLLLTPLLAPALEGNRPMHLLLSPIERTGKTKLAEEVLGGIILGRPTPALQMTGQEEERDKRVTALLMHGESIIHLDNLPPTVSGSTIASLLTSTTYQGRLLGASRMVNLPNTLIVVGSGNNTECSGEIAKRAVPIILDPTTPHPEARTQFAHPDLWAYIRNERRRILEVLLGMIEVWKIEGCPRSGLRMGGFENWSEHVGGVLAANGFRLWRSNAMDWARQADPAGEEVAEFVAEWWRTHNCRPVTSTDLARVADAANTFDKAMKADTERGRATAMGAVLRRLINTPVEEWHIRRREGSRRPTLYYLEKRESDQMPRGWRDGHGPCNIS